ncbi:MAG: hypothetical protein ACPGVG_02515 [Mycobacterium sp.]
MADRAVKALELRKRGMTYAKIGEELGVSMQTAHKDVKTSLSDLAALGLTLSVELRQMELERLDAALLEVNRVLAKYRNKPEMVLKAVDRLQRLSESRRKLLGIDQPQRIDVTTGGEPMQKRIVIVDSQDGTDQRCLTHGDEIETFPEITE